MEPFIVYIISTIVTKESEHIDSISVKAEVRDLNGEWEEYDIVRYSLAKPKYCIHLFSSNSETSIYSFPEHVLNGPFYIRVNVFFYFIPYHMREMYIYEWMESRREERRIPNEEYHYTPADETFRQDRCVVCLESTPNILYLDCMHIAVCDSCNQMKRTVRLRKNCDICRSEISKRIKI